VGCDSGGTRQISSCGRVGHCPDKLRCTIMSITELEVRLRIHKRNLAKLRMASVEAVKIPTIHARMSKCVAER